MLFEKIDTTRGEVPQHLRNNYNKAKDEFMNIYESWLPKSDLKTCKICPTGTDLIKQVGSTVDKLLNKYLEDHTISCKKGCSLCCKQLICCTRLEIELILEYINNNMLKAVKKEIKKKLRKEAIRFATWTSNNLGDVQNHSLISDPIRAQYHGKPCVFLHRNMCRIYPVRPVICRVTKVDDDGCGKPVPLGSDYEGQKPLKLFYDQVAVELIRNEEKRLYKEIKMLPVVAWPLIQPIKKYFFQN